MHSARINQIRATPDFSRVVTVGQDKTVRIWRASDLQLLRTLNVPSEPGEEGSVRALALTPDGRQVLVGGWTGINWRKQAQLYRFDLQTGELLQTLRGFPEVIESLAISRDGRRLALGLGGGGLQIVDSGSGQRLGGDPEYRERVTFADFAPDGSLATTSQDGCVRLYDPAGKLVFRAEYPPRPEEPDRACQGSELGGIRFSPDGRWIAFGVQDRPEVVLMDARLRAPVKVLHVSDQAQVSLCCIAWSPDSLFLYFNGNHSSATATPLYRASRSGFGDVERRDIGRQKFTNMLPLPGGDLVFSTNTPSLTRVRADGTRVADVLPPNGDFRFAQQDFLVGPEGDRLALPMRADGSGVRHFNLPVVSEDPDRAYRAADANDRKNMHPPVRRGQVRIESRLGDYSYKQPTLSNGKPLALGPFQQVWSWATHEMLPVAALGTEWSVLLVDGSGRNLWEAGVPSPAYQVSITRDGRWVVAALGDGTIRWFERESGREALGVFLHTNGVDWVAWRPDGYYASSPQGDQYMGWLVNRGDEHSPDFYRAVQFERRFYRPDLVFRALETGSGTSDTQQRLGTTLAELAAPRVTIEAIEGDPVRVKFRAEATGRPIREVGVYVDGLPVLRTHERMVSIREEDRLSRTVELPRGVRASEVRVEAETDASIGLDETAPVLLAEVQPAVPGKLWLLSIGVHEFEHYLACDPDKPACISPLPNAPRDAEAIVEHFKGQARRSFSSVEYGLISDNVPGKPLKSSILGKLRELENAGPNDTVVLFLASHGVIAGNRREYFFVPRDARLNDLGTLISADELSRIFRRIPGRRVLILDTCHSGAADGSSNPYTLIKRSASAQVAVFSAAMGNEFSFENEDEDHGAFTAAFLDAVKGAADFNRDGDIDLTEAFQYVRPAVARNMERLNASYRGVAMNLGRLNARYRSEARDKEASRQDTQTPTLVTPPVLQYTRLSKAVR